MKKTQKKSKPAPKETSRLRCPHCKASLTASQILEAAELCWPNQCWIGYDCPACKVFSHAELSKTKLSVGELDGFPGPSLVVSARETLVGVAVVWSDNDVKVGFEGRQKSIPAKT